MLGYESIRYIALLGLCLLFFPAHAQAPRPPVDAPKLPPPTIEEQIRAVLPPIFVHIAEAESSLNPRAKSPTSTAKGLMQILDGTAKANHCAGDMYNAQDNIACAVKIYQDAGLTPWNSSKGSWGKYLNVDK